MPVLDFIILALATWRLASLISSERGPYYIFQRIRHWAGEFTTIEGIRSATTMWGQGLICLWCVSCHVGLWFTVGYIIDHRFVYLCLPLALSTVATLIEKLHED